jgi:methyl-accepting chemotaxis protein
MLSKLSIKLKIIAVCSFLATLTCITGAVSYLTANKVEEAYKTVSEISLPNSQLLGAMNGAFKETRIHLRALALPGMTTELKQKEIDLAKKNIGIFDDLRKTYEKHGFEPGKKELYASLMDAWTAFQAVGSRVVKLVESNPADLGSQLERIYQKDCPEAAAAFEAAFANLIAYHTDFAKKSVQSASESQVVGHRTVLGLSLGSFVLALIVAFLFSTSLSRSLVDLAERLARGATQVASASGQISSAGADLSSSATQQAAALQETVASVDEVSAMVSKNADNAKRSQAVANSSHQAALRGKKDVDQMQSSIEEINQSNNDIMRQTESSNQNIANIVKVIAEIGNKTKVINDIVFQTKLLSFNASVEAARAGEHGKGFAVVAEEVGNLAQMSGNAAKEISQMLEDSIRKVETTVAESKNKIERLMVNSKEKVEGGMNTARRCGEALEEIVRNVGELNHMVTEISTASQEQAQGVQEINKAMGQLDQVTQQNATSAQQSAAASSLLNTQATMLNGLVDSLVATVRGEGAGARGVNVAPVVAAPAAAAQVIAISRSRTANGRKAPKSAPQKVAVGSDVAPSADDSRFEDI